MPGPTLGTLRDLVIIGAGGHGRELLDIVEAMNVEQPTWSFLGFLDDGVESVPLVAQRGGRILGPVDDFPGGGCAYALGIGSPRLRRTLDEMARGRGGEPIELKHPTAIVGGASRLGSGSVLAANSVVTTNVVLGRSVHLNVGCSVSHDCRLADYTILAPGVRFAGGVTTGVGVEVGIGAVVRPRTTIGDGAVIGAGAAVVADVEPGAVMAGVPARRIR